jgi:hypothetical protein
MMIEKEDWTGRKTAAGFVGASLVFSIVFLNGIWTALAQQQIAIGAIVKTQIACGESASVSEPYDATIALVEVIRGAEALKRLKASSNSNPAPAAGYEYILANIRFEMKARGAPGDKTFELGRALQFSALSADFAEYPAPTVVLPKPELKRRIASGDQAEGWIAFAVKQGESKPLMVFDPSSGGAVQRGKSLLFQLYQ